MIQSEEKDKPMKKDTQGFLKQADLTRSVARHREYDRKRCAAMSMLEREKRTSAEEENMLE